MYGLRNGLGAVTFPDRPVFIDPGYPADPAIVAQNTANNNSYQVAVAGAQAQNNYDSCVSDASRNPPEFQAGLIARCGQALQNAGAYTALTAATPVTWYSGGGNPTPFEGVNNPAPAGSGAGNIRAGQLTFTTSRGSNSLQVGDTWLLSIANATPNTPVTVSGSMPSGSFQGTAMGSTDGSGNFSKSGTIGPGDVGSWSESWAVGSVPSGSFSFTVASPVAQAVKQATGGAAVAPTPVTRATPSAAGAGPVVSDGFVLPTIGGFDLSLIPWWGWAGAAGVALMAFNGGGGRR